MSQQINIQKVDIESNKLTKIEYLAIALSMQFDGPEVTWRQIKDVFTQPYSRVDFNLLNPNQHYYCDDIEKLENGETYPKSFIWRHWCYVAAELLTHFSILGLTLNSENVINIINNENVMEVKYPPKE